MQEAVRDALIFSVFLWVAQVSPKKPRQTLITMISRDVAESLAGKQLTREQPQAEWGWTNYVELEETWDVLNSPHI